MTTQLTADSIRHQIRIKRKDIRELRKQNVDLVRQQKNEAYLNNLGTILILEQDINDLYAALHKDASV